MSLGQSRRRRLPSWLLVAVAAIAGCSSAEPRSEPTPHAAMPHTDHTPRFGGLVLMERDIHFEVVARASGQYRVYFSNDRRDPLPATTVNRAEITVMRPEQDAETVPLQPDAAGESWIGKGRPIESGDTMVRISYVYRDQPYWIDVAFGPLAASAPATRSGSNPR
jgi:hypothetical protein